MGKNQFGYYIDIDDKYRIFFKRNMQPMSLRSVKYVRKSVAVFYERLVFASLCVIVVWNMSILLIQF